MPRALSDNQFQSFSVLVPAPSIDTDLPECHRPTRPHPNPAYVGREIRGLRPSEFEVAFSQREGYASTANSSLWARNSSGSLPLNDSHILFCHDTPGVMNATSTRCWPWRRLSTEPRLSPTVCLCRYFAYSGARERIRYLPTTPAYDSASGDHYGNLSHQAVEVGVEALGYLITACLVGGPMVVFVIGMDIGGFAPDMNSEHALPAPVFFAS